MKIEGITVHDEAVCVPPCPFHAPSDHPLKAAPVHLRADKDFLVERICEHGVGHDDPDSVAYLNAHGAYYGVHGCDGCCTGVAKATSEEAANTDSQHEPKEGCGQANDTTFEDELKATIQKWESQGRTEEQKWAVRNFFTGAGLEITAANRRDIVRWMEYMLQCDRDNKAAGHKWSSGDWRKFVEAEIEQLKETE